MPRGNEFSKPVGGILSCVWGVVFCGLLVWIVVLRACRVGFMVCVVLGAGAFSRKLSWIGWHQLCGMVCVAAVGPGL